MIQNSLFCVNTDMKNIIGMRFGKLLVENLIEKFLYKSGKRYVYIYECRCDCGTVCRIERTNLITNHTKSCGCLKRRCSYANPTFSGFGEIGARFWNDILKKALHRNIIFEITIEQAWHKFQQQKGKCALSGVELCFVISGDYKSKTASLDRIDSKLGHTIDNIQWVHKDLNIMKGTFSSEKFFELCSLVMNHVRD